MSKTKRKYFTAFQRNAIARQQEWKCKQCCNLLPAAYQIDHICPLFQHGTNSLDNLQALCSNCHSDKSLRERSEYELFKKQSPAQKRKDNNVIVYSKYFARC